VVPPKFKIHSLPFHTSAVFLTSRVPQTARMGTGSCVLIVSRCDGTRGCLSTKKSHFPVAPSSAHPQLSELQEASGTGSLEDAASSSALPRGCLQRQGASSSCQLTWSLHRERTSMDTEGSYREMLCSPSAGRRNGAKPHGQQLILVANLE